MTPDWDAARDAFTEGGSFREIATQIGVSPEGVRKRSKREGWTRATEALAQRDAERQANTTAAVAAVKATWAQRAQDEADAAGVYASLARQAIRTALDDRDAQMVRATAIAYGILIDKAQLLSGGSTARTEMAMGEQAAHALVDELRARRELRSA